MDKSAYESSMTFNFRSGPSSQQPYLMLWLKTMTCLRTVLFHPFEMLDDGRGFHGVLSLRCLLTFPGTIPDNQGWDLQSEVQASLGAAQVLGGPHKRRALGLFRAFWVSGVRLESKLSALQDPTTIMRARGNEPGMQKPRHIPG